MPDVIIAIATTLKPEHTHWLCKKIMNQETRQRCDNKHPVSTAVCTSCGNERIAESEAQDDEGNTLGVLVGNDRRVEVWYYF